MARDVEQKEVGVAASRTQEEGAEETHDEGVAGTAGPDKDKGKVVGVDDHLPITKVGRPGEESDKQREELPKVDVEWEGERKPGDATKGGEREREPAGTKDTANAQTRGVGEQVEVDTGDGGSLDDGDAVPDGKEGQPPHDVRPGGGGETDVVMEAGDRSGGSQASQP